MEVSYCDKSFVLCEPVHVIVSAVFVEILKGKGYLLKVSMTNRYSLFLNVNMLAVMSCPRSLWYIPWDHWLGMLGSLVLDACFAAFDILGNVHVSIPGPIYCGSCSVFHFFYTLMHIM